MVRPGSPLGHMRNFLGLSRFLKPYWKRGAYGSISAILGVMLMLPLPLLSIYVIDYIIPQKDLRALAFISSFLLLIIPLRIALNLAQTYSFQSFNRRVMFDLRIALFRHLQQLSLPFLQGNQPGYLAFRISDDVRHLDSLFAETYVKVLVDLLTLAFGAAVIFRMNWRLSLLSLSIMPFLWSNSFVLGGRLRALTRELQEVRAAVISRLVESIAGSLVTRAFRREKSELLKMIRGRREEIYIELRVGIAKTAFGSIEALVSSAGSVLILWYGASEIIHGNLSLGQYVAFNAFLGYVYGPLKSLAGIYFNVQRSLGALERVFGLLDMPPAVKDCGNARPLGKIEGEMAFESVSFAYPGGRPVLKEVSFRIDRGERIAVVGESGAGKSTLLSLICRFHDPGSGSISLDGRDISEIPLRSLRDAISFVEQGVFLFEGSVCDNIRFGKPGASRDEVMEAARIANCHDFIKKLPEGYDTDIRRLGGRLSYGERQRICLARAFIRNPGILILDEAMSAIDSESESRIREAMVRVMEGRTAVFVSHRLSTVMTADRVVVLRCGTLIEKGEPRELVEREGYFHLLFGSQFKEAGLVSVRAG